MSHTLASDLTKQIRQEAISLHPSLALSFRSKWPLKKKFKVMFGLKWFVPVLLSHAALMYLPRAAQWERQAKSEPCSPAFSHTLVVGFGSVLPLSWGKLGSPDLQLNCIKFQSRGFGH